MKEFDEEKNTENSTVYRKVRRRKQRCALCPPNKGENAMGKRKPRSDKYKTKRKGR